MSAIRRRCVDDEASVAPLSSTSCACSKYLRNGSSAPACGQPHEMLSSVTSTLLHGLACACCSLRRPAAAPCASRPQCDSNRTATCRRCPCGAGGFPGRPGTTRRATPLLFSLCRPCNCLRKRHAGSADASARGLLLARRRRRQSGRRRRCSDLPRRRPIYRDSFPTLPPSGLPVLGMRPIPW